MKKNVLTILGNINTILSEANKKKATPMEKHKKEILAQVLLAFLYEKINLQEKEINNETKIYKEETVGGLKVAFGEGMFLATPKEEKEETETEKEYKEASIAARKYFDSLWKDNPFPYLAAPIQNGPAYVITNEGTVNQAQDFPDCVEVAIRHFFNVMLYNKKEGNFDSSKLTIANDKKEAFDDFYKDQHNRDLANNGSIDLRTKWNKVMANIPEVIYRTKDDGSRIDEIKKMKPYQPNAKLPGNEIKAGVINLYNVLAYLLGESQIPMGEKGVADAQDTMTRYGLIKKFYDSKNDPKGKLTEKLKKKFDKLLTQFACTVSIDFHLRAENTSDQEPDLYGNVEILRNKKTILTLEMQNGHGLLTLNLKELPKAMITEENIAKNPMLLLLPTDKSLTNYQTTYPYYASFHSDLTFFKDGALDLSFNKNKIGSFTFSPEEDEIKYIRLFVKQTEGNDLVGQSVKDYFKFILYEIDVSGYNDSEETVQFLDNIANDHDDNRKYVKEIGIYGDHSKNTDLLQNLNKFKNLESVMIGDGTIMLDTLDIDNCQKLKKITIGSIVELELAKLNITNCPKLESLNIRKNPKNITIDNCPELKKLTLSKKTKSTVIINKCPKLDKDMLTLDTEKHTITLDGEKLKNN